jgi:hypothetical protein
MLFAHQKYGRIFKDKIYCDNNCYFNLVSILFSKIVYSFGSVLHHRNRFPFAIFP